jgi:hypothetical protein
VLDPYIKQSNIIELVSSEEEEGESPDSLYQATLRILDEKRWIKMMVEMLEAAHAEEGFGLEPRKSFWYDEDTAKVKFSWVLLVWGDLEMAEAAIGDILSRRHDPNPLPPKSSDPRKRPTGRTTLSSRKVRSMDGSTRIITTTPLPHAKKGRYGGDPNTVVKVSTRGTDRRLRATVADGTDFTPSETKETL